MTVDPPRCPACGWKARVPDDKDDLDTSLTTRRKTT